MPVQIFSNFTNYTKFSPMRFRFEDRNHCVQLVEINQIISCKKFFICGSKCIRYLCNVLIKNRETTLELEYNVSEHNWLMFES